MIREVVFPVFNTSRLGETVSIENFIVVLQRISVKSYRPMPPIITGSASSSRSACVQL